MVITLGAGNVWQVGEEFLAGLKEQEAGDTATA
jgi:hypothetical protein